MTCEVDPRPIALGESHDRSVRSRDDGPVGASCTKLRWARPRDVRLVEIGRRAGVPDADGPVGASGDEPVTAGREQCAGHRIGVTGVYRDEPCGGRPRSCGAVRAGCDDEHPIGRDADRLDEVAMPGEHGQHVSVPCVPDAGLAIVRPCDHDRPGVIECPYDDVPRMTGQLVYQRAVRPVPDPSNGRVARRRDDALPARVKREADDLGPMPDARDDVGGGERCDRCAVASDEADPCAVAARHNHRRSMRDAADRRSCRAAPGLEDLPGAKDDASSRDDRVCDGRRSEGAHNSPVRCELHGAVRLLRAPRPCRAE